MVALQQTLKMFFSCFFHDCLNITWMYLILLQTFVHHGFHFHWCKIQAGIVNVGPMLCFIISWSYSPVSYIHLDLVITRILGSKAYSVLAIRSCYIASVNFDVCQCKVGLFSNVQSLITLFHGSLCMPNCLICMFLLFI